MNYGLENKSLLDSLKSENFFMLNKKRKIINNKKNYNDTSNLYPQDICCFENFITDAYNSYGYNNTFCVFKSINGIILLIYAKKNKSIIIYNLTEFKIVSEIKKAHKKYIKRVSHFLDQVNKRDLVMSMTGISNNIKIWDINYLELIVNIKNINKHNELISTCFLIDNNQIYILASYSFECSNLKVFDLKGNIHKKIDNCKEVAYYISTYYDDKLGKNYIITGNDGFCLSYDYTENKLYHKYCNNDNDKFENSIIYNHHCATISSKKEIVKLIESNTINDSYIRIWNFHSGELLKKIKINYIPYCTCLWNDNYCIIGCFKGNINIIDLKEDKIIKDIVIDDTLICIKKINHPKYGECLLSQGEVDGKIKLWVSKEIQNLI